MSKPQYISRQTRKIRKTLFYFLCLLGLSAAIFAQTSNWIYIARSEEGRYYVKRKIDQLPGGNPAIWMKIVSDNGSEQISYSEWDCKARRFRLKQTSTYAADGTAIEQLKDLDWAFVSPETVSESLIKEACGTPLEVKYALIILKEVKLRDSPNINGGVIRTAKRNEKFPLTPFDSVGAWYQIYDQKTLVEYWVHGNGIKIVTDNSESKKSKIKVVRKKVTGAVKTRKQK